ncbi:retrotransposon protein, putative, ty1-copia subclass [Tanacetum coccineum]
MELPVLQGLRGVRKLKQGALYLYMGNGIRAQVEVIGSFDLVLPNGLVIYLDNCHYAPTITRGVVPVSHLVDNGFIQCFTDYGISVSKNDVLYFNAIPRDGIYEIDMLNLVPNVNSIYNVSNKRAKHNLDSTYLWHCRLAHISKKRVEKLQRDGLLKSTDDESFDQCVSCLSGKMTRKPFPHRTERVTDLLGLIHTDVCGPLRRVSRQGASYFITFTDDYSRYGYVYLLKHKHEVFETFKVFKTEVENQLGKTIKALRSDRGGEKVESYLVGHSSINDESYNSTVILLGLYSRVWGCDALMKRDTSDKLQQRSVKCIFIGYPKETMGYYIYFPPENKIVVASKIHVEVEGFKPPQEEVIHVRMSVSAHRAPERLCLNVEVEEHNNQVWRLVDLPPNGKTVGSKWLFKKKTNMDGVAFYDYEIWKMDVQTTLLNGYLDEDIYMVQPEGFFDLKHHRKVGKLHRSIYGLKQASRSWNKRFDEEIKKFSFAKNLDEPCVYQKASGSNVTFLILYVDDIIIMGNHIPSLQSVQTYLGKCFAMKDLGDMAFILGIKIYRDRSKRLIELSQNAYMDKILNRFRMDTFKHGYIPMQERLDLNKTQGASTPEEVKRMQNVPYASAVGSIMYAVRCIRTDVAFA